MIIVRLSGGLGNQLFQYSFGRNLSLKHGCELKLDLSFYENQKKTKTQRSYNLGYFNIHEVFSSKSDLQKLGIPDFTDQSFQGKVRRFLFRAIEKRKSIPRKKYLTDRESLFDPLFLSASDNSFIEGSWQSEKYFKKNEAVIRKELTPKFPFSDTASAFVNQMKNTESVSLHIRRGDYANTPKFEDITQSDFYKHSINLIRSKVKNPVFYIFSDDIDWVKNNFKTDAQYVYVSQKNSSITFHEELFMMSHCKHNIIANSSFSWWGAWLNPNSDKIVVAPSNWLTTEASKTNEIIPDNWIKI